MLDPKYSEHLVRLLMNGFLLNKYGCSREKRLNHYKNIGMCVGEGGGESTSGK